MDLVVTMCSAFYYDGCPGNLYCPLHTLKRDFCGTETHQSNSFTIIIALQVVTYSVVQVIQLPTAFEGGSLVVRHKVSYHSGMTGFIKW